MTCNLPKNYYKIYTDSGGGFIIDGSKNKFYNIPNYRYVKKILLGPKTNIYVVYTDETSEIIENPSMISQIGFADPYKQVETITLIPDDYTFTNNNDFGNDFGIEKFGEQYYQSTDLNWVYFAIFLIFIVFIFLI